MANSSIKNVIIEKIDNKNDESLKHVLSSKLNKEIFKCHKYVINPFDELKNHQKLFNKKNKLIDKSLVPINNIKGIISTKNKYLKRLKSTNGECPGIFNSNH